MNLHTIRMQESMTKWWEERKKACTNAEHALHGKLCSFRPFFFRCILFFLKLLFWSTAQPIPMTIIFSIRSINLDKKSLYHFNLRLSRSVSVQFFQHLLQINSFQNIKINFQLKINSIIRSLRSKVSVFAFNKYIQFERCEKTRKRT